MALISLPKEMKAIQVVEFKKPYQINNVPVPDPSTLGPHDLLVKVAVASYCHTDSMIQSGVFDGPLPMTASHEGAGTVVAGGSAVREWVGARVMCGLPFHPCGQCSDCTGSNESWRQYCTNIDGHCGVQRDGFFAQYAVCDARSTTMLPPQISFLSAAPLACAGRTVWRGVEEAGLAPGQWLALVGSGGGLGHLGVQLAKKRGLNVVGIDARDDGLAITRDMGADVVVDARRGSAEVVGKVQEATGDAKGVDATVVLSDAAGAAALGCAVTRMHGTLLLIAQPNEVVIPFQEFVFRDIRVRGSLISSAGESEAMVKCIADKGLQVKTQLYDGLNKIEELLEAVHSGKMQGKAVIVVDLEQIEKEKDLGAKY
ncbi:unnamed protein product [Discula destructiva]